MQNNLMKVLKNFLELSLPKLWRDVGLLLLLISVFGVTFFYSTSYAVTTEHFLSNGMKVLLIKDINSPFATFQIWYKVGSKDEPAGKTGISHLLEHMMFKGTKRYGSKEFSNIIQRNGGIDNAFTTKDYTVYFQNLSADKLNVSIELEADRMQNLLLDPKDVEAEREVVKEERRLRYEDDPQNLLYEETIAVALKAHPYRTPIIGWMSDIASIQREDLYNHYKRFYSPDNSFIVIAGNIDRERVLSELERHFGIIKASEERPPRIQTKEPPQSGERRVYLKKEAQLPYVMIAYPVPNFPHPDSFALEVLSTILSKGKSSRLYKNLVYDRKIALNVFASYSGFYQAPFLFLLGGTPSVGKTAGALEEALVDEIKKLQDSPVELTELQKAKNQIEASFVFAQDSAYAKAFYTGLFEMLGGWRLIDRYLEGIRAVKPEDIMAVAKKYFSQDTKTVGTLIPKGDGQ